MTSNNLPSQLSRNYNDFLNQKSVLSLKEPQLEKWFKRKILNIFNFMLGFSAKALL